MTAAELSSIENGIWMCQTHGKMIDADEATYTPGVLVQWRKLAEFRAKIRQQFGGDIDIVSYRGDMDLASFEENINLSDSLGERIREYMIRSCAIDVWGRDLHNALRELLFEVSQNAFKHGGAKEISMEVDYNKITISYDGTAFSLDDLANHSSDRGGASCIRSFRTRYAKKVVLSYFYKNDKNNISISFPAKKEDVAQATPCCVTFDVEDVDWVKEVSDFVLLSGSCETIYLVPTSDFSFSHLRFLPPSFRNFTSRKVLVTDSMSESLLEHVKERFPDIEVMQIHRR